MSSIARRGVEILREDGPTRFAAAIYIFGRDQLISRGQRTRLNTIKNRWVNRIRYDAPADPYKTITIEPRKIKYRNKSAPSPVRGLGQIRGGDWESPERLELAEENETVKGLKQRFQQGREWEDTVYYRRAKRKIDQEGIKYMGCETIDQYLNERCEFVDDLYAEIAQNGYRTESDHDVVGPTNQSDYRNSLEALITIDRDGNIHLYDGHHRFAIAQLLDLKIPAHVVCIHTKWQSVRDRLHNTPVLTSDNETESHPDLNDIIGRE